MSRIFVQNGELETQINALRGRLNADSELRLFKQIGTLTRDMEPTDFTEADYAGYVAIDLAAAWEEPRKLHDGVWSIKTPIFAFLPVDGEPGAGGNSQTVKGAFVLAAGDVAFAGSFPGPVPLELGSRPLEFAVEIQLSDGNVFLTLALV